MKIRIVATDDSIWAQTIGRIFYGLCEMMAGIICTCIAIVLFPIVIVWQIIESIMALFK
jgi:hypothetical protein